MKRNKVRIPRRGLISKDSGSDFDSLFNTITSAIGEIHTKNASKLSFEELYRSAYRAVLNKQGLELYNRVIEFEKNLLLNDALKKVTDSISPLLLPSAEALGTVNDTNERQVVGERFLLELRNTWEDYQLCMSMITDVLMYMDRTIVSEQRKQSIYAACMCLFRDVMLKSKLEMAKEASLETILRQTILFLIHLEREGIMIERPLIRHCIYMLEGLHEADKEEESSKLYFTSFEPDFLESSSAFYIAEGQKLLSTTDAPTFCKKVASRIREEQERCHHTLSSATEPKILSVVDDYLIKRNISEVIKMEGSGVKEMLDNDRLSDLSTIYELVSRIDPQKTVLTRAVQARIVELGSELNTAAKDYSQIPPTAVNQAQAKARSTEEVKPPANIQTVAAVKWVNDVLQLKNRFDRIWEVAFVKDQQMQASLTTSFSEFININARGAEYISLFFDENLKKGIKGKSDEEIDTLLDNGITLLRYIRDKDLFETYYKKHLSRRLLMKRSVSMDAERQMISKMKLEVGNSFTARLESMFRDMATSEDLTTSYKSHLAAQGDAPPKRIELEINVLTSTMWPMEIMSRDGPNNAQCVFPKNIDFVKKSFEAFYFGKHSGRKLTWQGGMGTADIRATWVRPNGKIERHDLNVSTYAMIILVLFNDVPEGESLTFEEIQAETNIPTNDLIRNLQSLAVATKTRILKKDPMSKDVKPTDRFFYNENFQSKFTKLKIGVVSSGGNRVENKDERHETEHKMDNERKGTIEAAIVRTMKQRKKLAHSQLLTEVISQLASRFVPDVTMIKQRIESLIEREYLERLADIEPPTYGYVA